MQLISTPYLLLKIYQNKKQVCLECLSVTEIVPRSSWQASNKLFDEAEGARGFRNTEEIK